MYVCAILNDFASLLAEFLRLLIVFQLRPEKSPIRSPVPPSKVDNLLDVVIDLQDDNKKLREDNEKLRTALKTAIKDAADLRQRFDMVSCLSKVSECGISCDSGLQSEYFTWK
jgi:outer membrane murein-binding lipoprotein Lpp